jgi:hypothetical protein
LLTSGPKPYLGARCPDSKQERTDDDSHGEGKEYGHTGIHQRADQNLDRDSHKKPEG